jgi:copper oxidase (laccase) domain-containing protein
LEYSRQIAHQFFFAIKATGIVGAAHSGWQGALKGIAQNTVKEMVDLGADISKIKAVVGPCISQKNYEVGEEFLETFLLEDQYNMRFFANGKTNKYHFDFAWILPSRLEKCRGYKSRVDWTLHI